MIEGKKKIENECMSLWAEIYEKIQSTKVRIGNSLKLVPLVLKEFLVASIVINWS